MTSMSTEPPAPGVGGEMAQDTFKIRFAHNQPETTAEARFLVQRRYQQAGYVPGAGKGGKPPCPDTVTLATFRGEEMMGTMTLGFDTGRGLLVDELYKAEIDALRAAGRRVCEFTKLAIDNKRTSKRLLAGLFHVGMFYTESVWGYTDIVIEVNPAHVGFYQRMLGFQVMGGERFCQRVHAPAVLLRLETSKFREMANRYGGHPELSKQERTLYPYFLSPEEERRILSLFMQG